MSKIRDDFNIAIAALEEIKNHYGKVCESFEICKHESCSSSYGAWEVAYEALRKINGCPLCGTLKGDEHSVACWLDPKLRGE